MLLRLLTLCASSVVLLFLTACDSASNDSQSASSNKEAVEAAKTATLVDDTKASAASEDKVKSKESSVADKKKDSPYKTVEWLDLMPKDDLEVLLNPPAYIDNIAEGSEDDQISNQMQSAISAASDDRYQQALSSTRVVKEMDGALIRIPGFIVPLEFSSEQVTTEFFLVPFFGACIHSPPPPPNQIIFVSYPKGVELASLYTPFWLSGKLRASLVENDMATAAYSLELEQVKIFSDDDYE